MTMLSTHLVMDLKELMTLRSDWSTLHERSSSPTVFLTWEWVISWVEAVYPAAQLFVILVRDQENNLIAVAPFYLTSFSLLFCQNFYTLRCIGDCHAGAEYPDIIIKKGYEDSALKEIAILLHQKSGLWDWAWFPNVASWTGACKRLQCCFVTDKLSFCRQREKSFSTVLLPDSWDEYMRRFSRQRRSMLRRQRKKVEQKYDLQVTMCSNHDQLDPFLEQLFYLHQKRWQLEGHGGAFVKSPPMAAFYRKMGLRSLERGWLALFSLSAGDQVVAVQYGYVYDGVFSQVQEGFDPDGPVGVGNILRMHVIRWCIEHNIRGYDFLGGYTAHKAHWQAKKRIGYELFLGRNCTRNKLVSQLPFWPTGHYISQGKPAVLRGMDIEK